MERNFRVLLPGKQHTQRLGEALASSIENRAVIALNGTLGAGKTTLVKALAAALGVEEVVNSPTFTMLNEYHSGRLPLYHMDLYRLSEEKVPAPLDLMMAEIEEFIDDDMILVIEWAELFPEMESETKNLLSNSTQSMSALDQLDPLVIDLQYSSSGDAKVMFEDDSRSATIHFTGTQSKTLFDRLRVTSELLFLE